MSKIFERTQIGSMTLKNRIIRGQETIAKILSDTPIQYVSMARPFTANPDLMMELKSVEEHGSA